MTVTLGATTYEFTMAYLPTVGGSNCCYSRRPSLLKST